VPDEAGLSGYFEMAHGVTVEEALLAVTGLVALVLLFLGLTQTLEGDARARLRARRRRSRRLPARPVVQARPGAARSARAVPVHRDDAEPLVDPTAEPAAASDSERGARREWVATHIRRRQFGEARELIDQALASGDLTADDAEFLLEVCSTAITRDLSRLRRARRRGPVDESPLSAAIETTRLVLESAPAATLAAEPRQRAGRQLWRGHTRLGLRRWRHGDFEAAAATLLPALSVPGLDERRRRLARELLVRTLEDAAGESLALIPQRRGDGDRAAAMERAQRVLEHIRRAREEGIPAEDLAVATSRARQLLEHIEPTSVQ
jgi:hypothetical protein